MGTERLTTSQVAELLGHRTEAARRSTARTLQRAGIRPVAREPGRAGENLYDAEQVRAWHEGRPGSGRWGTRSGESPQSA